MRFRIRRTIRGRCSRSTAAPRCSLPAGGVHGRSDYRAAAVIRPDADYAADAARILRSQRDTYREHGVTSASYGLALLAYDEISQVRERRQCDCECGLHCRLRPGPYDRRSSAVRIESRTPQPALSLLPELIVPMDRSSLIPALKNIATRLRIDSIEVDDRSRQRPPHQLLFGGGDRGRAVLCRDALRSAGSAARRQRSVRAVEGTRRTDSLRGVGRGRRVRSRGAAEAAADRLRSRRSPDAAAAVRRRRDRIARAGHLRRRRHRA